MVFASLPVRRARECGSIAVPAMTSHRFPLIVDALLQAIAGDSALAGRA